MSPARPSALLAALAVAAACLAAPALPAATPAAGSEQWVEMRIGGVSSGYGHEVLDAADPDNLRTTSDTVLVVSRLDARFELREHQVSVEGRAGVLKHLRYELHASKEATVLELAVNGRELEITTEAGGRSYRRVEHDAHDLLGPEGVRALTASRLAAGAERFEYATFAAEIGRVVLVRRHVIGRTAATDAVPSRYEVDESIESMPGPVHLVVAGDGRVVEESQPSPFGELTTVETTAAVQGRLEDGARLPVELYSRSLVRANVRLPEPRSIDRLRVRIDLKPPGAGFPELEGPGQHVLERGRNHVVLEITRADDADAPRPEPGAQAEDTAPNYILQSDHPDVVALAESLRVPGADPYAQARALQDWVAGHMQFDPGLAMVPASEAVRDRRGSCVAYSVLLASLARALGIPARIVEGYVYVANVWGGHAWTEIRVGRRWLPLDAAVYRPGPADATHIALVRHGAEQGAASGASELLRVFGNESIRILGYRRAGTWVEVPSGASPYAIDGNRYRNPWLGLSVEKPAAFDFAAADAVYPDLTVVALTAPDGSDIRLRQLGAATARVDPGAALVDAGYLASSGAATVAGRAARYAARPGHAAYAFRDGLDLWLLEASGADALARLDEVASRLELEGPARPGAPPAR